MNFELAAKTLSLCYKTELVDGTDYEVHWIHWDRRATHHIH